MNTKTFTSEDGLTIAYHEVVTGDQSCPIILHHGFSANTVHEWVETGIIAALEPLGRQVLSIDARGHGQSDKPHDEKYYGEAKMARDVKKLADLEGLTQYDFAGYSMGGVVASIMGTIEPRIRRLIIAGVGEGVLLFGGVERRAFNRGELARVFRAENVKELDSRAVDWRRSVIARGGDLLALACQADNMHEDPIPLDKITAQTLVLAGDNDDLAREPKRLADAIPNGQLTLVPGDHTEALRAPEFAHAFADFFGSS